MQLYFLLNTPDLLVGDLQYTFRRRHYVYDYFCEVMRQQWPWHEYPLLDAPNLYGGGGFFVLLLDMVSERKLGGWDFTFGIYQIPPDDPHWRKHPTDCPMLVRRTVLHIPYSELHNDF